MLDVGVVGPTCFCHDRRKTYVQVFYFNSGLDVFFIVDVDIVYIVFVVVKPLLNAEYLGRFTVNVERCISNLVFSSSRFRFCFVFVLMMMLFLRSLH